MDAESFVEALMVEAESWLLSRSTSELLAELWLLLCLPMPYLPLIFLIQGLPLIMEPESCLCPGDRDTCERFPEN